jgi:aryl-alcohol dehydrogenase-like predicted oxidoreductase
VRYTTFGRTGLRVSQGNFGTRWGAGPERHEAKATCERFRDAGGVATSWLNERSRRLTTSAIPIIGPRSLAQLEDYLAALEVELTADQCDRRTRVSEVPLGIPHDANARQLHSLQSGLSALIDGPRIPVA